MNPRILVVEDEPFSAARLNQQLVELGYDPVATSASGEEAESIAEELRFDLALVDLRLAGEMDGISLAVKLRERFSLPSVLITGAPDKKLIERAIEAQPYGYLNKPYTEEVLRLTLKMAFQRLHTETTLLEREEQLKSVLRTSMDSFWVAGLDGRIIDVNEAACRMTGYTRSELLCMNLVQLEHGRTTEQIAAGISQILQTGSVQIERLTKRKDGQVRLIDMSVTCSPPPQRRLYCFGRDITDRRRNELALQDRESQLRATLDSVPETINLKDLEGRYLAVNAAWRKRYDQRDSEIIGKTDFDLFPREQALQYWQRDEQVRKTPEPLFWEIEHNSKDGRLVVLEIRKLPFFDSSGCLKGIVSTTRDITEQRRSEQALKESEHNLRSTLDSLPDAAWLKGRDGRYLAVNAVWCKIYNQSQKDVIGKSDSEIFSPEKAAFYAARDASVRQSLIPLCTEIEHNYGEIEWLEVRKSPLFDSNNHFIGLVGITRDITQRRKVEMRLQLLKRAVEQSPASIVITDPEGNIEYVNPYFERNTGYSSQEVIGANPRILKAGDQPEAFYENLWATIKAGGEWRGEFRNKKKDGSYFWEQASISAVRNEQGKIVQFIAVKEDITERKQHQLALSQRQSYLIATIENQKGMVWLKDLDGRFLMVNRSFSDAFGLPAEAIIGKTDSDITVTELSEGYQALDGQVVQSRSTIVIEEKIAINGIERLHETVKSPVFDHNGRVIGTTGYSYDITERKNAEYQLVQRESYLRAIIENQPGLVWLKDTNSRFLAVNHEFAKACGRSRPEEMIGLNDLDIWPQDLACRYRADDSRVMQAGKSSSFEEPLQIENQRRWFETFKSPVLDANGQAIGITGYCHDITERKHAHEELLRAKEQAETANKAKSAFLTTMSHELRTPLNVINGMAAILGQDNWSPEHRHAIDLISEGGQTLLAIIEEILDYSGLQAGKTKLETIPFSVINVAGSALRMFATSAQSKGINLTCSFDPRTPAELSGDPRRLQQVLVNLLQNAIKFTEQGRIHLQLVVREVADDFSTLEFAVHDSGIGIAAENLKKLFLPFSQAEDTITRRFGGTGMGLAITKSFVNLMGGKISVRSRFNHGSVFQFNIKLATTGNKATAFAALAQPAFRNRRVLVSRRNGIQHRMLDALLRTWEMESVELTASNIQETSEDVAILPVEFALNGRLLKCPTVWYGRKDISLGANRATTSSRLGTYIDPTELSNALTGLLTTNSSRPPAGSKKTGEEKPQADLQQLSILAAEDNRTNREVIKLILSHLGYGVDLVNNGAEAVEAVQKKSYDLLLLDVQMPVMDGLTAAREICRIMPNPAQRLKIVALTANALPGDRESCLEAGMDAYLTKPILPADLKACISSIFDHRAAGESSIPKPTTKSITPAPAGLPWVDTTHLRTITMGMTPEQLHASLSQLYFSVCADYQDVLPQIIETCTKRDQAIFAQTIHGLKGCFMMTGWTRAGTRCAQALAAARKNSFTEWQTFPDELKSLYKHSSEAMSLYLEQLSATSVTNDGHPTPADRSLST